MDIDYRSCHLCSFILHILMFLCFKYSKNWLKLNDFFFFLARENKIETENKNVSFKSKLIGASLFSI